MFQIKICGVTNVADARIAADAGADAVGLNFFRGSRRCVEPATAREIAAALPGGVAKVGVFVNHPAGEIARAVEEVGLDYVQLHGDERPELVRELPAHVKIVRAHRCRADELASLADYLNTCREAGRLPDAVLLDADAGPDFGGSGTVADWAMIDRGRAAVGGLPVVLAGGLTPLNVAAGIAAVRPDGVDVASGVEGKPGRKVAKLAVAFVAAAREAFARVG